jgi:exosome complex RNA-binding protein Rrp4
VFGTDVLRNAEDQVRVIRENLRVAQSRQKSYADNRRRDLAFEVGDYVYLKVSPMRSVKRFNMKGKLAPRYVGPDEDVGFFEGDVCHTRPNLEFGP